MIILRITSSCCVCMQSISEFCMQSISEFSMPLARSARAHGRVGAASAGTETGGVGPSACARDLSYCSACSSVARLVRPPPPAAPRNPHARTTDPRRLPSTCDPRPSPYVVVRRVSAERERERKGSWMDETVLSLRLSASCSAGGALAAPLVVRREVAKLSR